MSTVHRHPGHRHPGHRHPGHRHPGHRQKKVEMSDQQKERRPSAEFAVLQVVLYPDSTHLTSNPSIIGIIFYKLLYPKHWNKFIQYLVSITTNLSHI